MSREDGGEESTVGARQSLRIDESDDPHLRGYDGVAAEVVGQVADNAFLVQTEDGGILVAGHEIQEANDGE